MYRRREEARNEIQLGVMASLAVSSMAGLILGPKGSVVVYSMDDVTQRLFTILLLSSTVMVLLSAIWATGFAASMEIGGLAGVGIALVVFATQVVDVIPFWATSIGAGFGFIALFCFIRSVKVWLRMRRLYHFRMFRWHT